MGTLEGMVTLIVEDDVLIADLLSELLEAAGHEVIICNSYDQAMEHLGSSPIDVVLSDVDLRQNQSGADLVDTCRAQYPNLRFVLMSGHSQDSLQAWGMLPDGEVGFLQKPFSLTQVLEAIGPQ